MTISQLSWPKPRWNVHPPECVLVPIHFASNNGKECFAVYDDFDAVLLYHFVEFCRTVYVFEVIG